MEPIRDRDTLIGISLLATSIGVPNMIESMFRETGFPNTGGNATLYAVIVSPATVG